MCWWEASVLARRCCVHAGVLPLRNNCFHLHSLFHQRLGFGLRVRCGALGKMRVFH